MQRRARKRRIGKRAISFLLVFLLLFGELPLSAYAGEPDNAKEETYTSTGNVEMNPVDVVPQNEDITNPADDVSGNEGITNPGDDVSGNEDTPKPADDVPGNNDGTEPAEEDVSGNATVIENIGIESISTTGIDLTDAAADMSGEGWSWDQETLTLTLTDLTIEPADGGVAVALPAGSTLWSKGTENVLKTSGDCALGANGALTIKGSAPLTIESTAEDEIGMWVAGRLTVDGAAVKLHGGYAAFIIAGDAAKNVLFLEGGSQIKTDPCVIEEYIEGYARILPKGSTGGANLTDVEIVVSADPYLSFSTLPEHLSSGKALDDALSVTLTTQAELYNASGTVTYQWYRCDDSTGKNPTAISGETGQSYCFSGSHETGPYYFFCRAKSGSTVRDTPVSVVVLTPTDKKLRTTQLRINSETASQDNLATEGWKWDQETLTLTLDGFYSYVEEYRNNNLSLFFSGKEVTILLAEGSENILYNNRQRYPIICNCLLTITGKGRLSAEAETSDYAGLENGGATLSVTGGAKVYIKNAFSYALTGNTISVIGEGSELRAVMNGTRENFSAVQILGLSDKTMIASPAGGTLVPNYHTSGKYSVQDAEGNLAMDVTFTENTDPYYEWSVKPEAVYNVKSLEDSMSLTLKATAAGVNGAPEPSYQWYRCADAAKNDKEAIDGAVSDTYIFSGNVETGTYYFYCQAYGEGAGAIETDVIKVNATPTGTPIYNTGLSLGTSDIDLSEYGIVYHYDAEQKTGTLKLHNATIQQTGRPVALDLAAEYSNFVIELTGENSISATNNIAIWAYRGADNTVTFTGGGSLSMSGTRAVGLEEHHVIIKGGTSVTGVNTSASARSYFKSLKLWDEGSYFTLKGSASPLEFYGYESGDFVVNVPEAGMVKPYSTGVYRIYQSDGSTLATEMKLVPAQTKFLEFETYPAGVKTSTVGSTVTLQAKAVLKNADTQPEITYRWYDENNQLLETNTTGTLTLADTSKNSIKSYYCKVSCTKDETNYEKTGNKALVAILPEGRSLRTQDMNLGTTSGSNAAEGYSWDGTTKTLTLDNFMSLGKVSLPADSTIVLKAGTNNYIYSTRYGNVVSANSNSTITGEGSLYIHALDATCITGSSILCIRNTNLHLSADARYEKNTSSLTYVNFEQVKIVKSAVTMKRQGNTATSYSMMSNAVLLGEEVSKGSINSSNTIYGVYNETTGYTEAVLSATEEDVFYFVKEPASIYTTSVGSNDITLYAEAAGTSNPISYTWYNAAGEIVATGNSLTISPTVQGYDAYYCKAVSDELTAVSNTAKVITAANGKKALTYDIHFYDTTASVDNLATYGYKWDKDSKTLTLDNFTTYGGIRIYPEATVCLAEGSSNMIISLKGNSVILCYSKDLTITGKGVLHITGAVFNSTAVNTLTLSDGAEVSVKTSGMETALATGRLKIQDENTKVRLKTESGKVLRLYNAMDEGDFGVLVPTGGKITGSGTNYVLVDAEDHSVTEAVLTENRVTRLVFTDYPERLIIANVGTESPTLTAAAKLLYGEDGAELTYTWYRSADHEIMEQNHDGTFRVPLLVGATEYYCVVSTKSGGDDYEKTGETITVAVGPAGRSVRTTDLDCRAFTADRQDTAEGWTWEQATKTLTLDNFICTGRVLLPSGATLRLKDGTLNYINPASTADSALYAGSLTITGGGRLEIEAGNVTAYAVRIIGSLTILETSLTITSNVEGTSAVYSQGAPIFKASNLTLRLKGYRAGYLMWMKLSGATQTVGTNTGSGEERYIYGTYNAAGDYMEAVLVADDTYFINEPEKIITTHEGDKVTLTAEAKTALSGKITYQWYATDNWQTPQSGAVLVGSGATLTLTAAERGGKYYYCTATVGDKSILSNLACVITAAKGKEPVMKTLRFSDMTESVDKLDSQGWKWDFDTQTLTISDMEQFLPFVTHDYSYTGIFLSQGSTVEVAEGTENNLYGNYYGIYVGKKESAPATLTIKGAGKLESSIFVHSAAAGTEILCKDGISLDIRRFYGNTSPLTLQNAKVKSTSTIDFNLQSVKAEAGSVLDVHNSLSVKESVTIAEGAYVVCKGSLFAGDVTVEKGGFLSVFGPVYLDSTDKSHTLTVKGMLQIFAAGNVCPLRIYNEETSNPVTLGEDVKILTPEGALLKENSSDEYIYRVDSNPVYGTLIIGDAAFEPTTITSVGAITGKAEYNQVLQAGAVTPEDATVVYTWQYADSPSGTFKDTGFNGTTYRVETKYAGKYLRVKVTGYGLYAGEVYSSAVGPVVGNPATLTGIYVISESGEEKSIGSTPFDGESFNYSSPYTAGAAEESVTYSVIPANEKAKITIENATNGFRAEGLSAAVPLDMGSNTIRITVSFDTAQTVYTVTQKREERTRYLDLRYMGSYNASVTASWVDKEGNPQTVTVNKENRQELNYLPENTKVTLTAVSPEGMRLFRYGSASYPADFTKEDSRAVIVLKENTGMEVRDSDFEYFAPEAEADWYALDKNCIQIKVESRLKTDNIAPDLRVYYKPNVVLCPENGTDTVLTGLEFTGTDIDGDGYFDYHTAFITEVDETLSYTVKVTYYPELRNSYSSPEEVYTTTCEVEKRRSVSLVADRDYVVLKPGESTTVNLSCNAYMGAEIELVSSTDTEVAATADCLLTKEPDCITIKAGSKEGTAYLALRVADGVGAKPGTIRYATAYIRVDVSSAENTEKVSLGTTTGTLNVYDDSAITVPVYQMNCGYPITGAEFTDPAVNEKFKIQVVNDRMIRVTPVVPEDSDTLDWAAYAKSLKGTWQSKIQINYNGTASRVSTESLTIKADAKAPSVKAGAVKFNSFYQGDEEALVFTMKGASIATVKVDTVKNTAKEPACPAWMSLSADGKSVVLHNNALTNDKASGKLKLKVWPEGYRMPAQITVSVSAARTVPKLKLSASSVKVANQNDKLDTVKLTLLSADKKVSLESLNITKISVAGAGYLSALSAKDQKTYSASMYYQVNSFNSSTGEFWLGDKYCDPASGKILLLVTIGNNSKQLVQIPLTVGTVASPTIKTDKGSITLNTTLGTGSSKDTQKVTILPSVSGYPVSASKTVIKVTDDKGQGDYGSALAISQSQAELTISCTEATEAGKTYKVSITVDGIEKPAVLTVKTQKNAPSLKLSKKTLTLNRAMGGYMDNQEFTVEMSIEGYPLTLVESDITITKADGSSVDSHCFGMSLYKIASAQYEIMLTPGDTAAAGNYKVTISAPLPDGSRTKEALLTVKVIDKLPTVKLSSNTITLNRDLGPDGYDEAVVYSKGLEGYTLNGVTVEIKDAKGNPASGAISCYDIGGADAALSFYAKASAEAGATYKATITQHLAYGLKAKPVTLTIKVVGNTGKSPVTIKSSAKGSLDITRPDSTSSNLNVTFNGWNAADYTNSDSVHNANLPVLTWKVYAYDGKEAVGTAKGALDANGLVAWGKSNEATPAGAGSWFVNTADRVENLYAVTLSIDTGALSAWEQGSILASYKYTYELTLTFPSTGEAITLKPAALKVVQSKAKFAVNQKAVTLSRLDARGRQLVTIECTDKDAPDVADIAVVKFADGTPANALEIYEVPGSGKTYAIGWKNGTVSNAVKSGTVNLQIYLKGNDPERNKPDAVLKLQADIR